MAFLFFFFFCMMNGYQGKLKRGSGPKPMPDEIWTEEKRPQRESKTKT